MIEDTLTRIADNLDRIADALERISTQHGEAVMMARLLTVERKVEAIADPTPAPTPEPTPAPALQSAPELDPVTERGHAKPVTHDDIRALAKQLIAAKGTKEWKQVLADAGADTVSALPAEILPDVAKSINALLS